MKSRRDHELLILLHNCKAYEKILTEKLPQLKIYSASHPEEALDYIEEAGILLSSPSMVTNDLLKRAGSLVWFASTFAGNEELIKNPNLPETVIFTKGTAYGDRMAEYVFTYLLYFTKNVAKYLEDQKKAVWDRAFAERHPGRLRGQTLGILGLGSIGKVIARRGKQFGMNVLGVKRNPGPVEGVDQVFGPAELDQIIPQVDCLVVILPLTPETYHLLGQKELKVMKEGSLLINIGRGKVIDEQSLVNQLKTRNINAVLDVFETEPLPPESELWSLENAVITPHISGVEMAEEICEEFVLNYARWVRGEPLVGGVDRDRGY